MWENARVDFFRDTAEKTLKTLVWDTAGRPSGREIAVCNEFGLKSVLVIVFSVMEWIK